MKTTTKPKKARISRVWIERKRDEDTIGIIAKAEIVSGTHKRQVLHSGGTWDSDDATAQYLDLVEREQLREMQRELASFGFGPRAIDYAMKNVERKEMP